MHTHDVDDLSFYTPQKSTPTSSTKQVLLPSTRKNLHQSQIDRAHASQIETNELLREIIEQNKKLIEQNHQHSLVLQQFLEFSKQTQ